jgi:hypothetical protein
MFGAALFIAIVTGSTIFHSASYLLYRRIVYAIIAAPVPISLPVLHRLFR